MTAAWDRAGPLPAHHEHVMVTAVVVTGPSHVGDTFVICALCGALGGQDSVVNVREAARILGVHENTVRNMADDGRLPTVDNPTPFRRFLRADVEALLHHR